MLIFLPMFNTTRAQEKYDYVWPYGYGFDITGQDPRLNFNGGSMDVEINNNFYWMDSQNASICSEEGDLLFFTNGCAIIKENAEVMANGSGINFINEDCEFGYSGSQDAMILTNNYVEDQYFVFHKYVIFQEEENPTKMLYSIVDNSGEGEVIEKNIEVEEERNLLTSYLTGIAHENKKDWWLVNPVVNDSIFSIFLIDSTGVKKQADQSTGEYFNEFRSSASGTARFSPDGKKLAIYSYYDQLNVYDFDRGSGEISNHKKIYIYPESEIDTNEIIFSSVEWSPNSRFLYTASFYDLHQIDTWEENIQQEGIHLIDVYNGTEDPSPTLFYLMALGPDCRIYMTSPGASNSNHIIFNPDELGSECSFVQNGLKLPENFRGVGLPNFPRYRVDEEEKCDNTITRIIDQKIYVKQEIKVYPTPSTGQVWIQGSEDLRGVFDVLVYDVNGGLVLKYETRDPQFQSLNLSSLKDGTYFIELFNRDRSVPRFYLGKVMIVH